METAGALTRQGAGHIQGLEVRVKGLGSRVKGLGFRFYGSRVRV